MRIGHATDKRNEHVYSKGCTDAAPATGAGMMECKKALEENKGDMDKAVEYLRAKGIAKAEKRAGKQTSEGLISELHPPQRQSRRDGRGQLRDGFRRAHRRLQDAGERDRAAHRQRGSDRGGQGRVPQDKVEQSSDASAEEQVKASGKPERLIERIVEGRSRLTTRTTRSMHQPWIREPKKTVGDLIKEASAKVGENIQVRRFVRYQMGEE